MDARIEIEPQGAAAPTAEPGLPETVRDACEIAASGSEPPEPSMRVEAGHCDYSARGRRRAHWYRMVWRGDAWQYFSSTRMGPVGLLASTRHQTVYGEVWHGEVVIQHDRGGPIDAAYLVVAGEEDPLVECGLSRTRDGQLRITLPDGRTLLRPNPRRR